MKMHLKTLLLVCVCLGSTVSNSDAAAFAYQCVKNTGRPELSSLSEMHAAIEQSGLRKVYVDESHPLFGARYVMEEYGNTNRATISTFTVTKGYYYADAQGTLHYRYSCANRMAPADDGGNVAPEERVQEQTVTQSGGGITLQDGLNVLTSIATVASQFMNIDSDYQQDYYPRHQVLREVEYVERERPRDLVIKQETNVNVTYQQPKYKGGHPPVKPQPTVCPKPTPVCKPTPCPATPCPPANPEDSKNGYSNTPVVGNGNPKAPTQSGGFGRGESTDGSIQEGPSGRGPNTFAAAAPGESKQAKLLRNARLAPTTQFAQLGAQQVGFSKFENQPGSLPTASAAETPKQTKRERRALLEQAQPVTEKAPAPQMASLKLDRPEPVSNGRASFQTSSVAPSLSGGGRNQSSMGSLKLARSENAGFRAGANARPQHASAGNFRVSKMNNSGPKSSFRKAGGGNQFKHSAQPKRSGGGGKGGGGGHKRGK